MKLSTPMSPQAVLKEVAVALPPQSHQNVIIIGSLAAGYHFHPGRRISDSTSPQPLFGPIYNLNSVKPIKI